MDWRHNPLHLSYPTTVKLRSVNGPTIVKCNVISLLMRLSRSRVLQYCALYETRSFCLS